MEEKGKKEKEITMIYDSGHVDYETGDCYDGFFEIRKKDKTFKMMGPGVYTTAEGDVYSGTWDNNKLVGAPDDEVTIEYHEGARYEGTFMNWAYSGKSRYIYPDGSQLACAFSDNCPVGDLTLTDPNGHLWQGKADTGFAWLDPVNHYYDLLDKTIEKQKKKIKTTPNPAPSIPTTAEPIKKVKLKN